MTGMNAGVTVWSQFLQSLESQKAPVIFFAFLSFAPIDQARDSDNCDQCWKQKVAQDRRVMKPSKHGLSI